ncbi:MAG: DUF4231 domain-containing protein [Actinomycetota bacterium]|nr:DUF4231 domain-containing protein [Actinomycetota bacterium]
MSAPALELPELFTAADRTSGIGQRKVIRSTAIQLGLLTVAAAGGAVTVPLANGGDWAALVGGVAFVAAALVRINTLTNRPDRAWYDGRAAAESIKTLAWRYAVGGDPFPLEEQRGAAEKAFVARLNEILRELGGIHLASDATAGAQITPSMKELRQRSLDDRKAFYRDARIEDQRRWYAGKAAWNERRAQQWNVITLGMETLGVAGAFLRASGVIALDLLGLAGAAVAAVTAWIQTKQHTTQSSAYSVAAQELLSIKALLEVQESETEWRRFVAESEEAISREHTLWRASRS